MKHKKLRLRSVRKSQSSHKTIALREKQLLLGLSDRDIKKRIKRINKDFAKAFKILQSHTDTVTFFGSARFDEHNPYYEQARLLAQKIAQDLKLTIVTGGGPGIMEAANRGAQEINQAYIHTKKDADLYGDSIAMTIELPKEQITNPYVSHSADFYYFFSRKVALAYSARAFICFPGGFGTLDEFFEVLTLKQTHKIPNIPIILFGSNFWTPLINFIDKVVYAQMGAISSKDRNLYYMTDNPDEVVAIIKRHNHYY